MALALRWFEVILILVAIYLLFVASKNTSNVLNTLGSVNVNAIKALQGR